MRFRAPVRCSYMKRTQHVHGTHSLKNFTRLPGICSVETPTYSVRPVKVVFRLESANCVMPIVHGCFFAPNSPIPHCNVDIDITMRLLAIHSECHLQHDRLLPSALQHTLNRRTRL